MSQSTIIVVDTGLDKFDLYCGSRQPAQSLGIELFDAKTYADDAALLILSRIPNAGAGRQELFTAIINLARENKELQGGAAGWLTVTVSRHD